MTQDVTDSRVNGLDQDPHDNGGLVRLVCADLLSLRAAVRRVLEADAAYVSTEDRLVALRFNREMCALRAEMAGIDKDEGGKP